MGRLLQTSNWAPGARKNSGPFTGGPPKELLHATIAPADALPGYSNQGTAPHQTFLWNVKTQRLTPYQHYYFDNFSKSLVNAPGGVETNRDSVHQYELAGYLGANGATVPKGEFDILTAPNTYWEQVADLIGPVAVSWGVKNQIYAPTLGRMSYSQWDGFSGLCTHADVPENNHWDLPIPEQALSILAAKVWTSGGVVTTKPPASSIPKLPPVGSKPPRFPLPSGHAFGPKTGPKWQHSGYYSSADRAGLRIWQAQMRRRGWNNSRGQLLEVDGFYGPETARVAKLFQQEKRLTPDALIGISTWNTAWTAPIT